MKKLSLLYIVMMISALLACNESGTGKSKETFSASKIVKRTASPLPCSPSEELVYQDDVTETYTEDEIRGAGVASFVLEPNDRLDIYELDGSKFGFLVLNEDLSFYMIDMPKKITARNIVPTYDFAAFEFDADEDSATADYLFIYVNKKKRMVKKADVHYNYQTFPDYLRNSSIELKPCDPLFRAAEPDQRFKVLEVKGDKMKIRPSMDEGQKPSATTTPNWITWRKGKFLIVNLSMPQ